MDLTESLRQFGVRFTEKPIGTQLSEDCAFEPPCDIAATISLYEPFRLGAFSHINGGYIKNVEIGRYCSLARDVQIGHGGHPLDWLSVSPLQYNTGNYRGWPEWVAHQSGGAARTIPLNFNWGVRTMIGNDVWIGNHVIIIDGVTVGNGAIIAAGSVVTRDVAPYSIVAGNPARLIRMRFEQDIIAQLDLLQWWRFSLADLGAVPFNNIRSAIIYIQSLISAGSVKPYNPNWITSKTLGNLTRD